MNQPAPPTPLTFNSASLGTNPWDSVAGSDQSAQLAAQNAMPAAPAAPAADPAAAYPAMQNAYGLGSPTTSANVGAGPGTQPINITMPDSSTRGANPWSLVGESNSRGGGPPATTPLSSQG